MDGVDPPPSLNALNCATYRAISRSLPSNNFRAASDFLVISARNLAISVTLSLHFASSRALSTVAAMVSARRDSIAADSSRLVAAEAAAARSSANCSFNDASSVLSSPRSVSAAASCVSASSACAALSVRTVVSSSPSALTFPPSSALTPVRLCCSADVCFSATRARSR